MITVTDGILVDSDKAEVLFSEENSVQILKFPHDRFYIYHTTFESYSIIRASQREIVEFLEGREISRKELDNLQAAGISFIAE